jgi:hypothetical protein
MLKVMIPEFFSITAISFKIPPYLPDLFPKLKMKLKGRRFEAVSFILRESQAVFDSIKENYFHRAFVA